MAPLPHSLPVKTAWRGAAVFNSNQIAGGGASPSLSARAPYLRTTVQAPMLGWEGGGQSAAPGGQMVRFLLSVRSLLRPGLINHRRHLSRAALSWDSGPGPPLASGGDRGLGEDRHQPWVGTGARESTATSLGWGQGPGRGPPPASGGDRGQGVQQQHVLLLAMSAAKATEQQAFRRDQPSLH